MAFANGKQVTISNNSFTFSTVSGDNTVAILAKHEGLDKMYNVTGATGTGQYAGVWGNVTNGSTALASTWKFQGGLGGMDETAVVGLVKNWTTFLGGTWSGTQTTKSWPAFWRANFKSPLQAGAFATVGLNTTGLSSGSVWLNGHNIGRFSGNTLLYMPEAWLTTDNTVVIYDASGNSPSSVKLSYFETRARYAYSTGTGGAGGASATGGAPGAGGVPGAGGTTVSGGNTSRGGTTATGGNTSRGGTNASGGNAALGGATNNGGNPGAGGSTGGAAASGTGGAIASSGGASAGVPGTGGTTVTIAAAGGGAGNSGGMGAATGGLGNNATTGGVSASVGGSSENPTLGDATQAPSSGCSCTTPVGTRGSRGLALVFGIAIMAVVRRRKSARP
jgi:hypothetical protein